MQLNEAIKIRLKNLMNQKNTSGETYTNYRLSRNAGLNPSLINDFFRERINYPRIDTLYFICFALDISIKEFFNDPIFDIENIDIKDPDS